MKTNKWLRITLMTLLALVAVGSAALAGYRVGVSQNPQVVQQLMQWRALRYSRVLPPQALAPAAPQADGQIQPQQQTQVVPQEWKPRVPGFNPRGFDQRAPRARFDRRDRFFPFPNLLTLALLAAVIWLSYQYAKASGWKLVRETPQSAAPAEPQEPPTA